MEGNFVVKYFVIYAKLFCIKVVQNVVIFKNNPYTYSTNIKFNINGNIDIVVMFNLLKVSNLNVLDPTLMLHDFRDSTGILSRVNMGI